MYDVIKPFVIFRYYSHSNFEDKIILKGGDSVTKWLFRIFMPSFTAEISHFYFIMIHLFNRFHIHTEVIHCQYYTFRPCLVI